ncbi:hypothetical protein SAMD00019534_063880, partial [Acytostelium subglobosum LB1]|uniref:hypothetical protein n=1 Tax=Acytostelium subglobosum LB1 TaxID=1410327 RepID=UPI000644BCC7
MILRLKHSYQKRAKVFAIVFLFLLFTFNIAFYIYLHRDTWNDSNNNDDNDLLVAATIGDAASVNSNDNNDNNNNNNIRVGLNAQSMPESGGAQLVEGPSAFEIARMSRSAKKSYSFRSLKRPNGLSKAPMLPTQPQPSAKPKHGGGGGTGNRGGADTRSLVTTSQQITVTIAIATAGIDAMLLKLKGKSEYVMLMDDHHTVCSGALSVLSYIIKKATVYQPSWRILRTSYDTNGLLIADAELEPLANYLYENSHIKPASVLFAEWMCGMTEMGLDRAGKCTYKPISLSFRWNLMEDSDMLGNNGAHATCWSDYKEFVSDFEEYNDDECPEDDMSPCVQYNPSLSMTSELGSNSVYLNNYIKRVEDMSDKDNKVKYSLRMETRVRPTIYEAEHTVEREVQHDSNASKKVPGNFGLIAICFLFVALVVFIAVVINQYIQRRQLYPRGSGGNLSNGFYKKDYHSLLRYNK